MQNALFLHQPQNPGRQGTVDFAGFDGNCRFVFAIDGVEVRRRMIAVVHRNDDAEKATEFRHAPPLVLLHNAGAEQAARKRVKCAVYPSRLCSSEMLDFLSDFCSADLPSAFATRDHWPSSAPEHWREVEW
jgi:hypothetical protein